MQQIFRLAEQLLAYQGLCFT